MARKGNGIFKRGKVWSLEPGNGIGRAPGTDPNQRILHKQDAHMAVGILSIREKLTKNG